MPHHATSRPPMIAPNVTELFGERVADLPRCTNPSCRRVLLPGEAARTEEAGLFDREIGYSLLGQGQQICDHCYCDLLDLLRDRRNAA